LDKYGFKLIPPKISISHIFPNGKYVAMYPSIEQTVNSIGKFSVKDGKAWVKLYDEYLLNRNSIINSINSPPASLITKEIREVDPFIKFED
jgi:beta-carotene ketolase (CrtO type)